MVTLSPLSSFSFHFIFRQRYFFRYASASQCTLAHTSACTLHALCVHQSLLCMRCALVRAALCLMLKTQAKQHDCGCTSERFVPFCESVRPHALVTLTLTLTLILIHLSVLTVLCRVGTKTLWYNTRQANALKKKEK